MRKERSVKQRLISAVLVLVMLFTSLLGTTFAWFTDSVSSEGNQIVSGSLKVDLLHKADGVWTSLKQKPDHKVFDYDKWEPGYTQVDVLRVDNLGSLALKYQLSLEVAAGTADIGENGAKLADVIDVYVADGEKTAGSFADITKANGWTHKGTLSKVMQNPADFLTGQILPTGEVSDTVAVGSQTVTIALHMQESAGNEYQNLSAGDIFVNLIATQWTYEKDSFGNDYDQDAIFPEINVDDIVINVDVENGVVKSVKTVGRTGLSVTVPQGVKVKGVTNGTAKLVLSVKEKQESDANVTLQDGEVVRPLDVHVEGVADDNETAIVITLEKAMTKGLNIGNYKLIHVEDGVSNEMTAVTTGGVDTHNEFYYDPATGDVTLGMETFSEVAVVAEPAKWEGNFDYSWYAADATEFVIANADQLAAFGAIVGGMNDKTQDSFSGKTVKLVADIAIGDTDSENGIVFYPIGYYNSEGTYEKTGTAITSGFKTFEGTFDGNGHTISDFYQNTWEMKGDNNYYPATEQRYRDGMGLFGKIYGGTVKNLTVENFSSDGEYTTTGVIAAYADGATFENIAIFNCNPRVYNIGNGGIVGCVGWYAKEADLKTTFANITVDNSNKISALWGSWDVACGGIVGQYYPTSGQSSANYPVNAGVHFENCHVAAQMDVYNDVCANYQYYAYRYAGILVGSVRENVEQNGHVYPDMDGITAKDCTVHFGDWNDFYYCELVANSLASYTHDHQMSRLEQVASVDVANMSVTSLEGETTDIPTSGRVNYVVVKEKDANGKWIHGDGADYATCYHFVDGKVWNHADAGKETVDGVEVLKEDKQLVYREFNNLVTGYGWGVTSKGVDDMAGVTILDREEGASVEKFVGNGSTIIESNTVYKLSDLFSFVNTGVALKIDTLMVAISDVDSTDGIATGIYTPSTTGNWEDATIALTGTGVITITIQDYYFCAPTTITLAAYEKIDSLSCTIDANGNVDKVYAHVGLKEVEVAQYTLSSKYNTDIIQVRAIYWGGSLHYDNSYPLVETIACSNHTVVGLITKQPTLTEQGMMTYKCAGCGYEYSEPIARWTTAQAVQSTQCKDFFYKDYVLNGARQVKIAETDPAIRTFEYVDVSDGTQDLTLAGWLGGIESEIEAFGYYLGNDYYNTVFSDGHAVGTDQDVINAGGPLAERYMIVADLRSFLENTSKDCEKITYVALLADNTLVTIWEVYACKSNSICDGEIKASADEMPYYLGGAIQTTTGAYAYQTTTNVHFNVAGNLSYNASTGGFSGTAIDFAIDANATQATFNKYKIAYYSSRPMKATVTYTLNGAVFNDVVYLESGKHMFSCLVPGYLNSATAKQISAIKVESITGEIADFILYDVTGESIDVYAATYYFQNANYKLGITLDMGGAIGYLEDLKDGNANLTNLINRADTGRLVQQSYYGYFYNDPKITMGGAMWSYNPVQGGNIDQSTKGRLIDIEVRGNSVYVKAQPADWAVKGSSAQTPCYMENVYSIYEGEDARVEVYNSFTDFSNLDHTVKSQELPAFYTVSYLGTFMYYDMNGNQVHISDLPDWANNPNGYFSVRSDKTWCAWYNGNYGVGLYAPNTDVLYAGRHEYNGSTVADNAATNYVAPLTDFKLELDKKFEYSYMLTTGSVDEIDATFNKFQDFEDNEMLNGTNAVQGENIDAYYVDNTRFPVGGIACDITLNNLKQGTTLAMNGWIGFRNVEISQFGYYVNGDSSNIVKFDPMYTEDGVLAAGGQFAKRYNFEINTAGTAAGTYQLTFVVLLQNGDVETIAEWTVEIVEEDEVKPTANVIILAGQSNAYGASPITSEMKSAYGTAGAFPNVYISYNNINLDNETWKTFFSNTGFEPYRVGIGGQGTTHFGPEFGIAQWLAQNRSNEQWFIVKYTAAGTILNGQWLVGDTNATDNYGLVQDMGGYLSDLMLNYVSTQLATLSETHDVKVHSFMWMQGESDSLTAGLAGSYQAMEQQLVTKVRDEYAAYTDSRRGEDISFISGAIAANKPQYSAQGNNWVYSDTVNQGKILNATQWYIPENTTSNVLYSTVSNGNSAYLTAGFYPNTLNGAIANSMWIDTSKLLSKYEAGSENGEADAAHYCSASMQKLGAWFVMSMNMYIKSYTGPNSCDHSAGAEFNTTIGMIVCSRCQWLLLAPNSYVAGESLYNASINSAWTLNADATDNGIKVTGVGNQLVDSQMGTVSATVSVIQSNPNVQQYVVIRYKTNAPQMVFASFNPGAVVFNTNSDEEWHVAVVALDGECIAGRLDIRCNINGNANSYTEISHVASFATQADANEYANSMALALGQDCPHYGYKTLNEEGNPSCPVCGKFITSVTSCYGEALFDAVSVKEVGVTLTNNGDYGIIVSGAGTANYGTGATLTITSDTNFGQYMVLVYKIDTASSYLGTCVNGGINNYGVLTPSAADTWDICNYATISGPTGVTGNELSLICNYGGSANATNIYGIVTFNSAEDAAFYCEYLESVNILGTLNGEA